MVHEMKLRNVPFNSIKEGIKTIEMRLNDEKRQLLNIGDTIEFTNVETSEKIKVRVKGLYKYQSFADLYNNFSKTELGYNTWEKASPSDMEEYYSKEEQQKYGVLGIKIEIC